MKFSELMPLIHLAYKGKGADKVPLPSTSKYAIYLSLANDAQDKWAEDPDNNWPSLFNGDDDRDIDSDGTIELDSEECRPTDPIIIDGKKVPIIHFDDRHDVAIGAYVTGVRGERVITIVHPEQFKSTSARVGIILYPTRMTAADSTVTCSNTRWLSYYTAAMLARNDPAKEDEADRIFDLATAEYEDMAKGELNVKRRRLRQRVHRWPRIPGV